MVFFCISLSSSQGTAPTNSPARVNAARIGFLLVCSTALHCYSFHDMTVTDSLVRQLSFSASVGDAAAVEAFLQRYPVSPF